MCEHCGCSSDSNHSHLIIPVKGMKSENCESRIETALNNLQGVLHAHADSHKGEVSIALDNGGDLCDVKNTLKRLGFND